ncbi:TPA: hypothetical protein N0F65_013060 [Lagenidium giganteum]|uniref:Mitochondrial carrier protein n=1 Tax=Lagenidium giganteum TaxID=4803 RepID=A0AAV2YMN9_9STRA|nr:TPA: hypothetical protein N0F65_013060 [Lagenidium giganteum]
MSTTLSSTSPMPSSSPSGMSPLMRAFFSGAVAGVVADSMLHPLDTINLRIKVQTKQSVKYSGILDTLKTIMREEGVRGYFGGLGTTMMCSPLCAAVYFGTYETLKATLTPLVPEKQHGMVYFASGAMSEIVISTISVPTEVIKCRLQLGRNPNMASGGAVKYTRNYRGTLHAATSIIRSEGLRGLYTGYSACLSVDTFYSAFQFLFYETLKTKYRNYVTARDGRERELTVAESLALGSMAGGCSGFITNPLDVLCVRLMTQGKNGSYTGLRHCLMESVRREGVFGLWKGASCRMMSIMPQSGICFGVYETIKHFFFHGELEDFDFDDL